MKSIVQGREQDIRVTSIILESDPEEPDKMSLFYCFKCRDALFQHAGNVLMIVPGGTKVSIPVIIQCKICKRKYLINSST